MSATFYNQFHSFMHSTDLSDKMHGISSQQYNWSYVNSKNSWTQLVIGFESSQFMFIRLGWTEPPKVNTRRQGTSARMALATNNRHTEEGSIKLQTTDALIGCKCSMTLLLDWTNCFVTVHCSLTRQRIWLGSLLSWNGKKRRMQYNYVLVIWVSLNRFYNPRSL